MTKKYNWAILGCGNIALKFATELQLLPNANLYATASRNKETAQNFANQFGFEKAYDSYHKMVKDPKVDIVYIATPHSHHLQHTLLCLTYKKAVLCEKAFAINTKEVKQMIKVSKQNSTFLMEAFWELFRPKLTTVLNLIKNPKLGKLTHLTSDFHFLANFNSKSRLFNLELGGGSLLDIGIYPVFTSLLFLGKPTSIKTTQKFSPSGSEESISISLIYKNGATALLQSSFTNSYKNDVTLQFENGIIHYDRFSNDPIILELKNKKEFIHFEPGPHFGYQFEAKHVMECLDKNLTESPILPLSTSLELIELLDAIRKEAGIVFPNHD